MRNIILKSLKRSAFARFMGKMHFSLSREDAIFWIIFRSIAMHWWIFGKVPTSPTNWCILLDFEEDFRSSRIPLQLRIKCLEKGHNFVTSRFDFFHIFSLLEGIILTFWGEIGFVTQFTRIHSNFNKRVSKNMGEIKYFSKCLKSVIFCFFYIWKMKSIHTSTSKSHNWWSWGQAAWY